MRSSWQRGFGFKHPTQYGAILLKPMRKIYTRLIVEEWDQMQRIFVSWALKMTTQSIIVGKLSACPRVAQWCFYNPQCRSR